MWSGGLSSGSLLDLIAEGDVPFNGLGYRVCVQLTLPYWFGVE